MNGTEYGFKGLTRMAFNNLVICKLEFGDYVEFDYDVLFEDKKELNFPDESESEKEGENKAGVKIGAGLEMWDGVDMKTDVDMAPECKCKPEWKMI